MKIICAMTAVFLLTLCFDLLAFGPRTFPAVEKKIPSLYRGQFQPVAASKKAQRRVPKRDGEELPWTLFYPAFLKKNGTVDTADYYVSE